MWGRASGSSGIQKRVLSAMAEQPSRIFIGTAARFRSGQVFEYVRTPFEDRFIYLCATPPATTYPNDVLFIDQITEGETTWHTVFEGRIVNSQLEVRGMVFRTSEAFWIAGEHAWQQNRRLTRASYSAPMETPFWRDDGWLVRTALSLPGC